MFGTSRRSTHAVARRRVIALTCACVVLGASAMSWRPGAAGAAPAESGWITGDVTDGADPLPNICVNVANGPSATTDGFGHYRVDGIEPGAWTVQFVDCNPDPTFVSEWYDGQLDSSKAAKVVVAADTETTMNPVTLTPGIVVSGTVTDGAGDALAGINVNANPYGTGGMSAGAQTGPDGTYRLSPLPDGDYRVQFNDGRGVWATQYWDGQPSWSTATKLGLTIGAEPPDVDAVLTAAGTISGRVTAADGVTALPDICVIAQTPYNDWFDWLGSATTDDQGNYTIAVLPSGTDIRLQFHDDCGRPPSYLDEWYRDVTDAHASTPIRLAAGESRVIDDVSLTEGITVAGKVTDRAGTPLPGISVNVFTDNGQGSSAQTDTSGNYVTGPVAPGSYRVQFRDDANAHYATQYWRNQPSYNSATMLAIAPADAPRVDDVDARLDVAASLGGTVTGPGGAGIRDECVTLVTVGPNGPDGLDQVRTDANGAYRFTRVAPAQVWVMFEDCNGSDVAYQTVFWSSATQFDQARPIELAAGDVVTGIDQELTPAGVIRGHVTDVDGRPLAGICVQAVTATAVGNMTGTDDTGNYQLVLSAAGDYTVQFVHCDRERPRYVGQTVPEPVHVELGQTVDDIDAVLVVGPPGSISGTVRNAAGVAVTKACVVVFLANQFPLFASVAADGTYTLTNIPSGTYALAFASASSPESCQNGQVDDTVVDPVDPTTTYSAQWWQGADLQISGIAGPDPIAQGATLVAIGPGQQLTGFDQCFGCVPPAPPTTTTTPSTTAPPPSRLTSIGIQVTGARRGPGTITLVYTADQQTIVALAGTRTEVVPVGTIFTATCTSTSGPTGTASGTGRSLVVRGVSDRAAYSCTVTAAVDGVLAGSSAAELVAPPGGTLPATGSDVGTSLPVAVLVVIGGAVLVLIARRRPPSAVARVGRRGRT